MECDARLMVSRDVEVEEFGWSRGRGFALDERSDKSASFQLRRTVWQLFMSVR